MYAWCFREAEQRLEAVESYLGGGRTHTIITGEDLDSFRNIILVLIYFVVYSLYWCHWHKLDNLRKLCATMKQEQLYWQILTYNPMTVGNYKQDCANWTFTCQLDNKSIIECTCLHYKYSTICSIICIYCCAHVTDIWYGNNRIVLSQSVHHL